MANYDRATYDLDFGDDPYGDMDRRITYWEQLRVGAILEQVLPRPTQTGEPLINVRGCIVGLDVALAPVAECEHEGVDVSEVIPGSFPPMVRRIGSVVLLRTGCAPSDPLAYTDYDGYELGLEPIVSESGEVSYPGYYFRLQAETAGAEG